MDKTAGQLTTGKLQALVEAAFVPGIRSRRDLAAALARCGEAISVHGVEAWFRHVDSNYNLKRESLTPDGASYAIPKRRWRVLMQIFGLGPDDLERTDSEFRRWCLEQARQRAEHASVVRPQRDEPKPVGQEAVWDRLVDGFARAAKGQPALVMLTGPSGAGKSLLLDTFHRRLEDTGCLRLRTTCAEHAGLPLIAIMDLFRTSRDALSAAGEAFERRFAAIHQSYRDAGDTGFESPAAFLDLASLLTGMARQQTLAVFVDDLHLADQASARWIDYLWSQARGRSGLKLLMVAAYRPGSVQPATADLIASLEGMSETRVTRVQPLDQASLKRLLDGHLDVPLSPQAFDRIWRVSFGRTAKALELLHLLLRREALAPREGYMELLDDFDSTPLALDIRDVQQQTIQRLRPATVELLRLASVLGITFDLDTVQQLRPQWSLETVLGAIEEAEQSDLLVHYRDRFRFRSPDLAKLLYDSMGDTVRARIHQEIATLLRSTLPSPEAYQIVEVAHHLRLAGPLANPAALMDSCRRAAFAAAKLAAWPQAIQFAATALQQGGEARLSPVDRARLLRLIASAWHQSGKADDAIHHLMAALEAFRSSGDRLEYARTLHELVRVRGNFGRLPSDGDTDVEELRELAAELKRADPRLTSRVYDAISARMMYRGAHGDALRYARKAKHAVADEGACTEKALAAVAVALGCLRHLELKEARENLDEALFTALEIGDQHTAARALQRLTLPLVIQGRLDDVEATVRRIRELEHPLVRTGELSIALAALLGVHALRARTRASDQIFTEARSLIESTGYFWAYTNLITAYAAMLTSAGDFAAALELLSELDRADAPGPRPGSGSARYRALIAALSAPGPATPAAGYTFSRPPGDAFDASAIGKYCIDLEIALWADDRDAVEIAASVIRRAYLRGARFTLGWPFCVPHLLGRAMVRLGRHHDALYLLISAHQLCAEVNAPREARAIERTLERAFPQISLAGGAARAPTGASGSRRAARLQLVRNADDPQSG